MFRKHDLFLICHLQITYGDPKARMPHLSRPVYNWKTVLYIIRKFCLFTFFLIGKKNYIKKETNECTKYALRGQQLQNRRSFVSSLDAFKYLCFLVFWKPVKLPDCGFIFFSPLNNCSEFRLQHISCFYLLSIKLIIYQIFFFLSGSKC